MKNNQIVIGHNDNPYHSNPAIFLGYNYATKVRGFSKYNPAVKDYYLSNIVLLSDILELLLQFDIPAPVEYQKYDLLIATRLFPNCTYPSIGMISGISGYGVTSNWLINDKKEFPNLSLTLLVMDSYCFNLSHALRSLAK